VRPSKRWSIRVSQATLGSGSASTKRQAMSARVDVTAIDERGPSRSGDVREGSRDVQTGKVIGMANW
jgi:hypothetical protein